MGREIGDGYWSVDRWTLDGGRSHMCVLHGMWALSRRSVSVAFASGGN